MAASGAPTSASRAGAGRCRRVRPRRSDGSSASRCSRNLQNSPAEASGFRSGDIILEADGRPIEDVADLQRLMVGEALDGEMAVIVWRDGDLRTIVVRPAELDAA